jgi:hypothetical protein
VPQENPFGKLWPCGEKIYTIYIWHLIYIYIHIQTYRQTDRSMDGWIDSDQTTAVPLEWFPMIPVLFEVLPPLQRELGPHALGGVGQGPDTPEVLAILGRRKRWRAGKVPSVGDQRLGLREKWGKCTGKPHI